MSRFTLTWKVHQENNGKVLRDFLKENQISRQALTDIKFKGGAITVNNQDVTVRYHLQEGDEVIVYFPPEFPSEDMSVEHIPLQIVYEDAYVLVINKVAGMPSIPSREHLTGTLANGLLGYYETIGLRSTVHIVNRLDKDTSGLMLVAKNRFIHHLFSLQQHIRAIKRTYVAIVEGCVVEDSDTIDAPIGRKSDSIIEREVRQDGQQAITHYRVLERKREMTVVTLKLETGRTHQIRVHMSYLGHPLVGDDLYGGQRHLLKRQALHSQSLSFYHPILKEELSFQIPLPVDMKALIEKRRE